MSESDTATPPVPQDGDWRPVRQASDMTGVPERTIYRHIAAKTLPTKVVGGVRHVEMGALTDWKAAGAARRQPPTVPPVAADGVPAAEVGNDRGGSDGGKLEEAPGTALVAFGGNLAAIVFGLFEAGRTPIQVVMETGQAPDVIHDLYRRWQAMGGAPKNTLPTPEEFREAILDDVRQLLGERVYSVNGVRDALVELRNTVGALSDRVCNLECEGAEVRGDLNQLTGGVSNALANLEEGIGRAVGTVAEARRRRGL